MADYGLPAWLLIFYIYCFSGWVFECIVVSVQERKPVNRGFLRGPMLPIYGFGAVLMLHVALPLTGQPLAIFFVGMVVATAFEYVVGVGMEAIFKVKYWNYSAHRFQFQGRICLQSSVAWGVLSVALIYLLHPPIVYLLREFNRLPLLFTVLVLSTYFLIDVTASVNTALNFARLLEELDYMRQSVHDMRAQLAEAAHDGRERLSDAAGLFTEAAAEKRDKLAEAAHDGRERLSDAAGQLTEAAESARAQLVIAIAEAEKQIASKIHNMKRSGKGLVRGNPSLRSARFAETLREIRERLK